MGLLQRTCACGGTPGPTGECAECRRKRKPGLQAKLKINPPGDRYEQEADRMAETVMRSPAPAVRRMPITPLLQRAATAPGGMAAPASVDQVLSSPGQPLDAGTRAFMEPRFGHNFSRVRIHTDAQAAASAQAVQARAYTVGSDMVFGAGQYAPGTAAGRRLLAHELTHVVQQQGGTSALRRQEAPAPLSGPEEAEQRALMAPRFPGCSPNDRRRLDHQLLRARTWVRVAHSELAAEGARLNSPSGIITLTGSALNTHFHTRRPAHIQRILSGLDRILNRLERGRRNWRCTFDHGCWRTCRGGSRVLACTTVSDPVFVCPRHFSKADSEGSLTLIHEAAHQAGMPGDTYEWKRQYANLSTRRALRNADSYTMFVRDSVVTATGSAAKAWTSREMSIIGDIWEPEGFIGRIPDPPRIQKQMHLPQGTRVINRFQGIIVFDVDNRGGGNPRRSEPFTAPEVGLQISLVRTGSRRARQGRPQRETLFERHERGHVNAFGRLEPTGVNNGYTFDFHFDSADRGLLRLTITLRDFDTATTLTFRDQLRVRPTAPPAARTGAGGTP